LHLFLQILGGIVLAVIILGIFVSVLKFIAEPVKILLTGILFLAFLMLPVFGLWFAFVLITIAAGIKDWWAFVLVAAVYVILFTVRWRFGRGVYPELFREFLKFLQHEVLGLTNVAAQLSEIEERNMYRIWGYGNRTIFCDGTGIHYIQFDEYGSDGLTQRTEPHFTTCDTWWFDCRRWEDQPRDGEGVLNRIVRELIRKLQVNREKRRIRKTMWLWKYYDDVEARHAVHCNNEHCGRLFILPGEKIVIMTAPGIIGRQFYLDPNFFKKIAFHVHFEIWSTPFKGYAFHYECLPESFKIF
jgi:hypothetical protein